MQGMWEFKSPLLQLPHITEENLKYFSSKKVLKLEADSTCCTSLMEFVKSSNCFMFLAGMVIGSL